jgi:3'-5' exonuclease
VDESEVTVVHLSEFRKIPSSLFKFLAYDKVVLHGVNIENDLMKLQKEYPSIDAGLLLKKSVDLRKYFNKMYGTSRNWSLQELCVETLKYKMDKNVLIALSRWDIFPLSENQLKYAANDVYVSLYSL